MGIKSNSEIHLTRNRKRNKNSEIKDPILVKLLLKSFKNKREMTLKESNGKKYILRKDDENKYALYVAERLTPNKNWESTKEKLLVHLMLTENNIYIDSYEDSYMEPNQLLYKILNKTYS